MHVTAFSRLTDPTSALNDLIDLNHGGVLSYSTLSGKENVDQISTSASTLGHVGKMNTSMAQRLSELRKDLSNELKRKVSAQEVADAVGISRSTLAGYEKGHGAPGRDTLAALASYYKVSSDFLFGHAASSSIAIEHSENFAHAPDEAYLLEIWRRLTPDQRQSWINLLKQML